MKRIHYKFIACEINRGTKETQKIEQVLVEKSMPYSEANEEIAKAEAYKGEYTIEDDDQGEPETPITLENRVSDLETDTADLAEALDMILSGVTE